MLRVLILDDDLMFARALQRQLSANDCPVYEAHAVGCAEDAVQVVRDAIDPFDVFLIDQQLGSSTDGIAVLRELQRISPDSDAIIFTALGDTGASTRAFRAGAYCSLDKPFTTEELLLNLRALTKWRTTRRERDWLRVLTTIAEAAQRLMPLEAMGQVIVENARMLGFERARLWLYQEDDDWLIGTSQSGNSGLEKFQSFRVPPRESVYMGRAFNRRDPLLYHGQELGESYLFRHFRHAGYQAPTGDWVILPLWVGERYLGQLSLDNHSSARHLNTDQLAILGLFARQAAAALERAQLYEQEQRISKELQVLAQIGQRISNRAAQVDLDTLLGELRDLLGQLFDIDSFWVALDDAQLGHIDLRLWTMGGVRQPARTLALPRSLPGYLIDRVQPLLLTDNIQHFCRANGIGQVSRLTRCLLGVPLCVEQRAIGAIIVASHSDPHAYDAEDLALLRSVAEQVAGAIQTVRLREDAVRNALRLRVLQRAVGELIKLGEQSDEWLWHTALTVTTAGYALGFNRAMLFLLDNSGLYLRGRMGIGQLSSQEARRSWRGDEQRQLTLDGYLAALRAERLQPTPVDEAVRELSIALRAGGAVAEALSLRRRVIVPAAEVSARLPTAFFRTFGISNYALLPLFVGEKRLGLLVVDNTFTNAPLHDLLLDQLDTLFTEVAQVYENLHQRTISDKLIDVNHSVLAEVTKRPLREILEQICEAAQLITGADSVVIRPLLEGTEPDELRYDTEHIGAVGLQNPIDASARPRSGGLTIHLLHLSEPQIVNDVMGAYWPDGQPMEGSEFIQSEGVRAFIAVPLHDAISADVLGIFYLHYRSPQTFNDNDRRRANSFAVLAGTALRASRANTIVRQQNRYRGRELETLRDVLKTARLPGIERAQLAHSLLLATHDLLGMPAGQIGLVLREWQRAERSTDEPEEVRRQYFLLPDRTLATRHGQRLIWGITGHAFETGENLYVADVAQEPWAALFKSRADEAQISGQRPTRSELDVLIRMEGSPILGLFNVESPEVDAFTRGHIRTLERVASVAALALDILGRQKNLLKILEAANSMVAAVDVQATLRAVLDTVYSVAPEISAVTAWYRDPETRRIVAGPHFGVRHAASLRANHTRPESALDQVMRQRAPIWAVHTASEPRLMGRFAELEAIQSTAAFPLLARGAQGGDEVVGALFINYRRSHEFSSEEQAIFPMLAAIAAASVRDALRLEIMQKQQARLQAAIDISSAVATSENLDATLRAVLQTLSRLFPQAQPCVLTYNQRQHTLEFAQVSLDFYRIDYPERVAHLTLNNGRSIACQVALKSLRRGEPAWRNVGDISSDPDYLQASQLTRAELCLGLLNAQRQLLGVLVLESDQLDAFSEEDEQLLLRGVGPAVSLALEHAYRNADLRFQSTVAGLTAWVAETAHDIKRELGNVRYHTYLLSQQMRDAAYTPFQPHLRQIDKSLGHLAGYAQNPQSIEPEMLWIDQWLMTWVREIVVRTDIRLRFALDATGFMVRASRLLLDRVLRHLLRNAQEAMAAGDTLTVRSLARNGFVEIQVANSGPPIPEWVRQRLFIEQVTNKPEGLGGASGGLGLLFVRWAVQAMNGQMDVTSRPNEDVVFTFTLPLVAPDLEVSDE